MDNAQGLLESEDLQVCLQTLQKWVRATRQHHALEHATLQLLAARDAFTAGGGVSDPGGFTLMGDMNVADTETAVADALAALRDGNSHLAIHPQCGSNLLTQAGLCLCVALQFFGPRRKRTFPLLVTALCGFLAAILGGRILGPYLQLYTTLSDVADREVKDVFPISVLGRRCMRVVIGSSS